MPEKKLAPTVGEEVAKGSGLDSQAQALVKTLLDEDEAKHKWMEEKFRSSDPSNSPRK
ncbi:MAG TPA: hypothetical protein VFE94_03620 [Candidatus Paceibacterota bacterium]|nr:hypothetical protein [Candidatus Paceibacterota bacterium]